MQMPAEHQRRMIKGDTGSLLGGLASCKLAIAENKALHAVVDILTILMAGSILAMYCMTGWLSGYGWSKAEIRAISGLWAPSAYQLGMAALVIGFTLLVEDIRACNDPQLCEYLQEICSRLCGWAPPAQTARAKRKKERELRGANKNRRALTGALEQWRHREERTTNFWRSIMNPSIVALWCMSGGLSRTSSDLLVLMFMAVAATWYVNERFFEDAVHPTSVCILLLPTMPVPFRLFSLLSYYTDFLIPLGGFAVKYQIAFMAAVAMASAMWYLIAQSMQSSDFSETTIGCSTRSRSARCQHQLLAVKKKSKRKAKRDKRAQSRIVIEPAEYASDSGYSSSGHDEHSSNVAMEDFNRMFSESDEDDGVEASSTIACLGKVQHDIPDCCVCLEEDAATRAVMPCRHLCLCADCGSIGLELCPICREEITDIVLVGDGDSDEFF